MKHSINYTLLAALLGALLLAACSHEPTRGTLEYQDRQVYMCRELCAAGTIEVHRIEGLNCICAPKKEAPVFYNPMMGGGAANPATQVFHTLQSSQPELQPRGNAAMAQDSTGRTIISQTKE